MRTPDLLVPVAAGAGLVDAALTLASWRDTGRVALPEFMYHSVGTWLIGAGLAGGATMALAALPLGIRQWRARRVEQRYFAVEAPAYGLMDELRVTSDPAGRADILDRLAVIEQTLADLHTQTWGPDPNPDEDGRDLAESVAASADLLRIIARAERSWATGASFWAVGEFEVVQLWCAYAATRDRRVRARRLLDVYDTVEPVIGAKAAETLIAIAHTERRTAFGPHERSKPLN